MRNRFKPNLTSIPRGSRRGSSQNANSEQQSSSRATLNQETEKVSSKIDEAQQLEPKGVDDVPFIPPHCQSHSVVKETENGCATGTVIIEAAKTTTHDTLELGSESNVTATSSSSSSSSVTRSVRRSRIKPAVTPVARSRPATTSKGTRAQDTSTAVAGVEGTKLNSGGTNVQSSIARKDKRLSGKSIRGKDGAELDAVSSTVDTATEDSSGKVSSKNGVHASSRTTVNTEESPEHIPTEASDMVGEVMTSDDVALESSEPAVGAPSLLRRKRVLPNLGSASKRRHLSVSRDPRESDAAVHEEGPVVVLETTAVEEEEDEELQQRESCSQSNKRPRTDSNGEKTADIVERSIEVSENHEDTAGRENEDDSRTKGLKRRREGRRYRIKEPSDPSRMTMQHLIYFNPKTNPMKSAFDSKYKNQTRKRGRRGKGQSDLNSQEQELRHQETTEDNAPVPSTPSRTVEPQVDGTGVEETRSEGGALAPRVKLSADGSIILDEESLLIPTSPEKSLADSEIVYEDADEVNYVAYLKTRKVEKWTMEDTKTFYKALSQVGTDFSLMTPLFPTRQRKELKAKFKREEKLHRSLVEKALRLRNPIDVEMFTPRVEGEEIDDAVTSSEPNNTIASTPEAGNGTSVSSAPLPLSSPLQ